MVCGQRQVGKSTMLNYIKEKNIRCVSFDDRNARRLAENDPTLFFGTYGYPILIDEFQIVPSIVLSIYILVQEYICILEQHFLINNYICKLSINEFKWFIITKMNTKLDDFLYSFEEAGPVVKTSRILYFDETNNIKKGVISKKDNIDDLENTYFVLGGIGTKAKLDFDELLNFIGGKQKPNDAKFKYFSCGKSSFLDAIKQPRLSKLFQYLFEHNIIIHFDVLHFLHFALIDILDSLIIESDVNQQAAFCFYKQLQSDMTEVLFTDYDRLHELLCNYEFPNIPKEKANDFVNELFEIYEDNLRVFDNENPDNFTKELLRQIIKAKRDKKTLYFLEDNKPFVICEKMTFFYILRMAIFKCKKYFDEEGDVIRDVEEMDSNYKDKLNVDFISSKDSREIQVSDAISGFVGRLYNFLSHTSEQQIYAFARSLNIDSTEFSTLKWFFKLMTISDEETNIYFMKVTPLFIERRFNLLVRTIETKKS